MRFKKDDNTYFTINAKEYTPLILINYELIELSGNKFRSLDRGQETDRYGSKITVYGKEDYISSFINALQELRDNNKPIIVDECEERIFGDHIYYDDPISCVIFDLEIEENVSFNAYKVDIVLLATDLSYNSAGQLPVAMKCLQHGSKGGVVMNSLVNETYNSDNYYVNRVADSYEFEGEYFLSIDDNADLFNYWRIQRGNVFTINETDFGITDMFGSLGGTGSHDVIIKDITYKNISPIHRITTLKLIKVS